MERIAELRKERGWSQVKLGAKADVNPSTVNQIERGLRHPNSTTLEKLADALDVEVADLFREAEAPKAVAPRKGAVQEAREKLATVGEEMYSEDVAAYLRGHGAHITLMSWEEFEALEDLTLPEFRQRRRALEVERESLEDAMDGSRISALALLRAQARATNWLHPEERRRLERAEELVNA